MLDIDKHLSDYQLLTCFNPHYHEYFINELYDDKDDLYHKSSGMTDYDGAYGITRVSIPVETLGIKLCSIDERIEILEKKFAQRTDNLNAFKSQLTEAESDIIDEYFYQQFHNHKTIRHPVIHLMREELYTIDLDQREERQRKRGQDDIFLKVLKERIQRERQADAEWAHSMS